MHSSVGLFETAALVGSPNSGKTTLFNWLTGLRYNTVNYPGSTVDYSAGTSHSRYGESVHLMDTPGVYGLSPKSPDEEVTINALQENFSWGSVKLVISVVDATHLSRQLLLTRQLLASGFQVIVAVTMMDLLSEKGLEIDIEALAKELNCTVVPIDGRLGGGVQILVDETRRVLSDNRQMKLTHRIESWKAGDIERVLGETRAIEKKLVQPNRARRGLDAAERTSKIDGVLLHPFLGLIMFLVIMSLLFTSIYWLATPVMDLVDSGFSWLSRLVSELGSGALWSDFLANGLVSSFGAVLVFVPQIFILFMGIALLEDSGYLARSATLMDRPLRMLGMSGRSFVPLLSGYACAVPAMMAARTVNSKRERWLLLFIIPLMSCSARLPVYSLLLTFVFRDSPAWKAGLVLAGIYAGSILVGALAAAIANRFIKIQEKSLFCLELPVYRRPLFGSVLRQAYGRTKNYIRRAGPVIFLLSIVVWIGTTFPHYDVASDSDKLNRSFFGQAGQLIEPVFSPMGVDWRVGVGLISAFAAREVFVSSLAIVFNIADKDEESMQDSLLSQMSEAKMSDGSSVFTISSVLGLIVFFMIALQCISTTGVAVRESGRWRFALMQLVVFNIVAYVLAVALVQGLRVFGIS